MKNKSDAAKPAVSRTRPDTTSSTAFWELLGRDHDDGISKFSSEYGLNEEFVTAFSIVEGFNKSSIYNFQVKRDAAGYSPVFAYSVRRFLIHAWTRKLQIFLSIGMPLLFIALIVITWDRNNRLRPAEIIVQRTEGLPAYYRIGSDDVRIGGISRTDDPEGGLSLPVGRITLSPIKNGSTLDERELLDDGLSGRMKDRVIVPFALKPDRLHSGVRPNRAVNLVFSNSLPGPEQSRIMSDVILLGVEKKESSVTLVVAMTTDQLETVKGILNASEVYIVEVP